MSTMDSCLSGRVLSVDSRPVRFRLLRGEDTGLWTDFVNGCSKESLWMRFLVPFRATPERARKFCDVDPEREFAVVAEISEDSSRKVIGIARLARLSRNGKAEFAVIVSDPWQRKRVGHTLSDLSVELARRWGVESVLSEIFMENHVMLRILKDFSFHVEERNGNMCTLCLHLS